MDGGEVDHQFGRDERGEHGPARENAHREHALLRREEPRDKHQAERKIGGLKYPKQSPQPQHRGVITRKPDKQIARGPSQDEHRKQPPDAPHAVEQRSDEKVGRGIQINKRGEQPATLREREAELTRDRNRRVGKRLPVEVVEKRRENQRPENKPAPMALAERERPGRLINFRISNQREGDNWKAASD